MSDIPSALNTEEGRADGNVVNNNQMNNDNSTNANGNGGRRLETYDPKHAQKLYNLAIENTLPNQKYLDELVTYIQRYPQWSLKEYVPIATEAVAVVINSIKDGMDDEEALMFFSIMGVWGIAVLEEAVLWETEYLMQSDPVKILEKQGSGPDQSNSNAGDTTNGGDGSDSRVSDKYPKYIPPLLDFIDSILELQDIPSSVLRRGLQSLTTLLSPVLQVCARYDAESFKNVYTKLVSCSNRVYETAKRNRDPPFLARFTKLVGTELVIYSVSLGGSSVTPNNERSGSLTPTGNDNANSDSVVGTGSSNVALQQAKSGNKQINKGAATINSNMLQFNLNNIPKTHSYMKRDGLETRSNRALKTIIAMIPSAKSTKESSALMCTSLLSVIGSSLRVRPQYTPRIMSSIPSWYNKIIDLPLPKQPKKGAFTETKRRWLLKSIGLEVFQLFKNPNLRMFVSDIEHALKTMNTPEYQAHIGKIRGKGGKHSKGGGGGAQGRRDQGLPPRPTTPPLPDNWHTDRWFVDMAISNCIPHRIPLDRTIEYIIHTLRDTPDWQFMAALNRLPGMENSSVGDSSKEGTNVGGPSGASTSSRLIEKLQAALPVDLRSSGLVRKRADEEAEDEDEDALQSRLDEEAKRAKLEPSKEKSVEAKSTCDDEMQVESEDHGGEGTANTMDVEPNETTDIVKTEKTQPDQSHKDISNDEVQQKPQPDEDLDIEPIFQTDLVGSNRGPLPHPKALDRKTMLQLQHQAVGRVLGAGPSLFSYILNTDDPESELGLMQLLSGRPTNLSKLVANSTDKDNAKDSNEPDSNITITTTSATDICSNQDMVADWSLIMVRMITTIGLMNNTQKDSGEDESDEIIKVSNALFIDSLIEKTISYAEGSPRSRFELVMSLLYELWHQLNSTKSNIVLQENKIGETDSDQLSDLKSTKDVLEKAYITFSERYQQVIIKACEASIFTSVQAAMNNTNSSDSAEKDSAATATNKAPMEIIREAASRETLLNKFMAEVPHISEKMMNELWERLTRDQSTSHQQQQMLTVNLCVFAMQSLVNLRPIVRSKSLEYLLLCCVNSDNVIRGPCIMAVKSWYPDHPSLGNFIEEAALMHLNDVCKVQVMVVVPEEKKADGEKSDQKDEDVKTDEEKEKNGGEQDKKEETETEKTVGNKNEDGSAEPKEEDLAGDEEKREDQSKDGEKGVEDAEPKIEVRSEDYIIRYLELYLALCSKNPGLLSHLFEVYANSRPDIQGILRQAVVPLIKSFSSSTPKPLIDLIGSFPAGAESLALRIIEILTDNNPPSTALVQSVMRVYTSRRLEARFLIPIILGLERVRVISCLPDIVRMLNGKEEPHNRVKDCFLKLVKPPSEIYSSTASTSVTQTSGQQQQSSSIGADNRPKLAPTDLLKILHNIEQQAGIPRAMEAIQICLSAPDVFDGESIGAALQSLVSQNRLPALIVRTMMQLARMHPSMTRFVGVLLDTLISKKIWTNLRLWQGVIKLARMIAPISFNSILSLPLPQMKDLLKVEPIMIMPLIQHVQQLPPMFQARLLPILESIQQQHQQSQGQQIPPPSQPQQHQPPRQEQQKPMSQPT
ncbi:hypothetical protein H4219_003837 [Mycoemilia scoparia]|uniref:Symplekin n=1 Tax=Mycoemilia scoparia TaxID=417184 RepID=A0A9W8A1M7_9FUNG|nr:hypothetical protein H4219_003837 [Mycoemilia scoparia]